MKNKIIERQLTNEDGDFYGVCGRLSRHEAYLVIMEDLKSWGIEDDVIFTEDELESFDFHKTVKCPSGEHEDYIWWGEPAKEDTVKFLGKGWGYRL